MAWTNEDTIEDTIDFEKLFETFKEWQPMNRARMLMYCEVDTCVLYTKSKLHKELPGEAANLLINSLVRRPPPGRLRVSCITEGRT